MSVQLSILCPQHTQQCQSPIFLGLQHYVSVHLYCYDTQYRRAVFDFRTDCPLVTSEEDAPPNAVLVMDGVFLLRPELEACWDYRIWVEVPFAVALERAQERDVALLGSQEEVLARYLQRYIPGQKLYLEAVHPQERADAIVFNEDPAHPRLQLR